MKLKVFTADAFTDVPFEGNPAAVVLVEEPISAETMLKIAVEFNFPQSCFVTISKNSDAPRSWASATKFGIRWFTVCTERSLCGHGTLAAAHIVFAELGNPASTIEFERQEGSNLLAHRNRDGKITLDFPQNPPQKLTAEEEQQFAGVVREITGKLVVKDVMISHSTGKLLVRLDDATTRSQLMSISPSGSKLLELYSSAEFTGVIVCIVGEKESTTTSERDFAGYHFVSRYFAPWVGNLEDPVCGSAHTVLGPYWSSELGVKTLIARQCSKRGGTLYLTLIDNDRIHITGKAVTLIEGTLTI